MGVGVGVVFDVVVSWGGKDVGGKTEELVVIAATPSRQLQAPLTPVTPSTQAERSVGTRALGFASQDVQNCGALVVTASSCTTRQLAAVSLQSEARSGRYAEEADVANKTVAKDVP